MKIPSMLVPSVIGIVVGFLFWLGFGFGFRWSLVIAGLVGYIGGMIETAMRGQD